MAVWTTCTTPWDSDSEAEVRCAASNASIIVAGGRAKLGDANYGNHLLLNSTDGTTFNSVTNPISDGTQNEWVRGIAWSGPLGVFAAIFTVNIAGIIYPKIFLSSDGSSWSEHSMTNYGSVPLTRFRAIIWDDDYVQFVAVGETQQFISGIWYTFGLVMTSPDGINWTERLVASDIRHDFFETVSYSSPQGMYVIAGQPYSENFNKTIRTSIDGAVNWDIPVTNQYQFTIDTIWSNIADSFLALNAYPFGSGDDLELSDDGLTWNEQTLPDTPNNMYCLGESNGNLYYAGYSNDFLSSLLHASIDGYTWVVEDTPFDPPDPDVDYGVIYAVENIAFLSNSTLLCGTGSGSVRIAISLMSNNDDFADAQLISGDSGAVFGTTRFDGITDATRETGEEDFFNPDDANNSSYGDNTVWYKWVAPASGVLYLTLDKVGVPPTIVGDTVIFVYDGTATVTNLINHTLTQNDDYTGYPLLSHVRLNVVSGETYYIRVQGYAQPVNSGGRGNFRLVWSRIDSSLDVPANDKMENAITLSLGSTTSGTTVDADIGAQEEYMWYGSRVYNVWYVYHHTGPDKDFDLELLSWGGWANPSAGPEIQAWSLDHLATSFWDLQNFYDDSTYVYGGNPGPRTLTVSSGSYIYVSVGDADYFFNMGTFSFRLSEFVVPPGPVVSLSFRQGA